MFRLTIPIAGTFQFYLVCVAVVVVVLVAVAVAGKVGKVGKVPNCNRDLWGNERDVLGLNLTRQMDNI